MWRFAVLTVTSVLVSCSPEAEVTGSTNICATDIYPSYNPKALDQCVAVCIKCDRGVVTTCSTSCTLKGCSLRGAIRLAVGKLSWPNAIAGRRAPARALGQAHALRTG